MYVKPENDIYSNRKIINTAQLLTWKSRVLGTILDIRLSSRFRAKCLDSKSRARDNDIQRHQRPENKTIVLISRVIYSVIDW